MEGSDLRQFYKSPHDLDLVSQATMTETDSDFEKQWSELEKADGFLDRIRGKKREQSSEAIEVNCD